MIKAGHLVFSKEFYRALGFAGKTKELCGNDLCRGGFMQLSCQNNIELPLLFGLQV